LCEIGTCADFAIVARATAIGEDRCGIWWGSYDQELRMNYRSLALAIASLSFAQIATADAQSVYVAPGGVYIGGGPVYVLPGNGNGGYVEPTLGGVVGPTPYLAPTAVYGNGGGYYNGGGYINGNGNGGYYNGNGDGYGGAVLSAYGRARLYGGELPPRPPALVPYVNGSRTCIVSRGFGRPNYCD
jgi:hypothetical protein